MFRPPMQYPHGGGGEGCVVAVEDLGAATPMPSTTPPRPLLLLNTPLF